MFCGYFAHDDRGDDAGSSPACFARSASHSDVNGCCGSSERMRVTVAL
jgi:hypothetical protein